MLEDRDNEEKVGKLFDIDSLYLLILLLQTGLRKVLLTFGGTEEVALGFDLNIAQVLNILGEHFSTSN
jgi:hypothetical protein